MNDYEITCPHDDCEEVLLLTWQSAYTLSPSDLHRDTEDGGPISSDMAHAETWQIECVAGHVVLLPGWLGCGCEDPEGPDCPHDPDGFDWSEDSRSFRTHDFERLRRVLARIGGNSR